MATVTRIPALLEDTDEELIEVEFEWDFIQVTHSFIEFQVVWDDPYKVSTGTTRDILVVKLDLSLLDETVTDPFTQVINVPKQLPDT